jgi:hypothetical protein
MKKSKFPTFYLAPFPDRSFSSAYFPRICPISSLDRGSCGHFCQSCFSYLSSTWFPDGQQPWWPPPASPLHPVRSPFLLWLQSEKENKQPKLPLQPSRLGKILPTLLVPRFKVHFTFYGGDQPSWGAGLSGPVLLPGGQLITLTSSFCLGLSGWVDGNALSEKGLLAASWSRAPGWGGETFDLVQRGCLWSMKIELIVTPPRGKETLPPESSWDDEAVSY